MNITPEMLLKKVDEVIGVCKSVDGRTIAGFATVLLEYYRHNPDHQGLMRILDMSHPRPQLEKRWKPFAKAVKSKIRDFVSAGQVGKIPRFLAYLKWKAAIIGKTQQKDSKDKRRNNKGRHYNKYNRW